MREALSYFLSGVDQVLVLGASLTVAGLLLLIGSVLGGRRRFAEATLLYGWSGACLAYTVLGVLFAVPFRFVTWAIAAAAVAAAVMAYARRDPVLAPGTVKAVLIALPLLLLAAAMTPSQWDEFSHWAPAVRFLFEMDGFPASASVDMGGSFPGYPYNWPLLQYMASRLSGRYLDNAGGLFNVMLLMSFGLAALRVVLIGAGREAAIARSCSWSLAALAVLLGTLLTPTFVQKIILTTYADTSTAVAAGFAAILGWVMLADLAERDAERAAGRAWQLGLVLMLLINIKQANLVLCVMVLAGIGLAAVRDPAIGAGRLVRLVPRMVIPPLVLYGLWRYHVFTDLTGTEALLASPERWNTHIMPEILLRMLNVASKKGLYFGIMAVAVGFAVKALVRPGHPPLDRLAIVTGTVFLGYNAFLFFIFVAQFPEFDALRVASYWRYNMHLGLIAATFAAFGVALLWKRRDIGRLIPRWGRALPVVLVLAAPIVFAPKLRFDLEQPKPHFHAVGKDIARLLPAASRIFVFDPHGSGESAVITKYHVWGVAVPAGQTAMYDPNTVGDVRSRMAVNDPTHVLVHSLNPVAEEVFGGDLSPKSSHLLEANGPDGWRLVRSWPHPWASE